MTDPSQTLAGRKFRRDLFEALARSKFGHGRKESFKRDAAGNYTHHDVFRAWIWFNAGMDAGAQLQIPSKPIEPDISI